MATIAAIQEPFEKLAEPLRRELKVHCYRMLGSLHEAEDAVQEAFIRGWRSFDTFDGRGPFRAWLYRIATNTALDAIARRKHAQRLLPNLVAPPSSQMPDGSRAPEATWLEPYPDSELENVPDDAPTPEARYSARQSVQLAFIAVLQELPPKQRAVLLLCDVLGWSAAECAGYLGGSVASVNSALQRSRETLAKRYPAGIPKGFEASDSLQKDLLGRYMRSWESLDVGNFASLLKEDAVYTMPPVEQWYQGRTAIAKFFEWAFKAYDGYRMVPIGANGQHAFAAYSRATKHDPWTAHSIHVLSFVDAQISELTLFAKPTGPRLFPSFGLPLVL